MVSLLISLGVTVIVAVIQFYFFFSTRKKLKAASLLFSAKRISVKGAGTMSSIVCEGGDRKLKTLIKELNNYMLKNEGTTDFSIIQNKTERYASSLFDNACAKISFPVYIGLMGTFLGVFMGLLGFELNDIMSQLGFAVSEVEEEVRISRLVDGVIVSMLTSLCGLLLTTYTNHYSSECKKYLDEQKNMFYDFVQNELMPTLGTSIVVALRNLKETLSQFSPEFRQVTVNFRETFNECTRLFGEEFRDNTTVLTNAVAEMGRSIEKINENVENQRLLLVELKKDSMFATLQKFVDAADHLAGCSESLVSLKQTSEDQIELMKMLESSQMEYMQSLTIPQSLIEHITALLDRVSTFEQSINQLGETISTTEFIGSHEMSVISEHLDAINKKNAMVQEYLDAADETMRAAIDERTQSFLEAGHEHLDAAKQLYAEFISMIRRYTEEVHARQQMFEQTLEEAFRVAQIHEEFTKLNELPSILKSLQELHEVVIGKDALIGEFLKVTTRLDNLLNTESGSEQKISAELDALKSVLTMKHETIKAIGNELGAVREESEKANKNLFEQRRIIQMFQGDMEDFSETHLSKLDEIMGQNGLAQIASREELVNCKSVMQQCESAMLQCVAAMQQCESVVRESTSGKQPKRGSNKE